MPFRIRTKLIIAFFAVIFPFIAIVGAIALYNTNAIRNASLKAEAISEELHLVLSLRLAIDNALMPGNDYIITGNKRYIDEFNDASKEVEDLIEKVEKTLVVSEGMDTPDKSTRGQAPEAKEEIEILKSVKTAWQNIKEISQKIFEIPEPVGNKEAAALMEEMDYKWAYPAIKMLDKHHEIDRKEHDEAFEELHRRWRVAWLSMIGGALILIISGIFFAAFYSRLFTRPIEAIHNGADEIASGNFKTRLDIKTGDELQQLSNAMNEMAAQLDNFYATLEQKVEERTREVKESEKRYRSLFGNMLNGFAYCRMLFKDNLPQDFIYLDVNKAFEKATGLKNVVGKKATEVIPGIKEVHPELFEIYGRVALTGRPEMFEIDFKPLSIWLTISVYSPERECFVAVFDNITERKKAEEALKESETRFRGIVETAKDAIICIKSPDTIYMWNKKAEEIFGYPLDETMGRSLHDLIVPKAYIEKHKEGLKKFFATGTGHVVGSTIEITGLKRDGTEFPIELSISAMNIRGEWHATSIIRDITARKEAEKKIKEQLDYLVRFEKATVQREFRIKELKDRVKELEEELKKK
ncbi:MAG: PAS domain S-box protein [Deltaproteobacteria bacterium]|nr:PAS domain S-box protein [Deltaproteobacteria bacterium]